MDVKNSLVDKNGGNYKVDSWGYVVCCGTLLMFVTSVGHISTFGLVYFDFMEQTHASAKSLTSSHGVYYIMICLGGILLNLLSHQISLRFAGMIGCLMLVAGTLSNVFITSMDQLWITFGVLQGLGMGIMSPAFYSILNYYFIGQRRIIFLSLIKAGQGLCLSIYPQFIKNIYSFYGFRGTLLIECGISLNAIAGIFTLVKPYSAKKNMIQKVDSTVVEAGEINTLLGVLKRDPEKKRKTIANRFNIVEMMNFKMLKDLSFTNICIGEGFFTFSDTTYFMLQPLYMFQLGFDKSQVANCISVTAACNVVGRCLLALLSSFVKVNVKLLYYVCTCLLFIMRVVNIQLSNYTWILVVRGITGVLHAFTHVSGLVIVCNHVPKEDLPSAYSILMLVGGIINFSFSPLIGLLKDVFHDYTPALYTLSACCLPCIILWPLEYFFYKK